jgi:DNA polymerase IV
LRKTLNDQDAILAVLLELSAGVGYRLRRAGFLSRTITLKLRYGDFRTITRSRTLPEPVDGDSEIYRTVRELFREHSGKPPWRLVGVQASGFELGRQLSLLTPSEAEEKEKQLTLTRDRLRKKYGSEVIIQAKRLKRKPPKGL